MNQNPITNKSDCTKKPIAPEIQKIIALNFIKNVSALNTISSKNLLNKKGILKEKISPQMLLCCKRNCIKNVIAHKFHWAPKTQLH